MSDQIDAALAVRVTRLEPDVSEMRAQMVPLLNRIDATSTAILTTLATRAELADLRAELKADLAGLGSELKGDLADKPGKAYPVGLLAVLLAVYAYASGLAALAIIK